MAVLEAILGVVYGTATTMTIQYDDMLLMRYRD